MFLKFFPYKSKIMFARLFGRSGTPSDVPVITSSNINSLNLTGAVTQVYFESNLNIVDVMKAVNGTNIDITDTFSAWVVGASSAYLELVSGNLNLYNQNCYLAAQLINVMNVKFTITKLTYNQTGVLESIIFTNAPQLTTIQAPTSNTISILNIMRTVDQIIDITITQDGYIDYSNTVQNWSSVNTPTNKVCTITMPNPGATPAASFASIFPNATITLT